MDSNLSNAQDLPLSVIVEKVVTKTTDPLHNKLDTISSLLYKILGEKTYSISEIAKIVNKNYYTIRRHIDDGILEASQNGRGYTISHEQFQNYLAKKPFNNETRSL